MPAFIRDHGFVDHLLRVALDRGVPPVDAYRMATLNPATYYGLDAELGGIAPGRWADVCVLRDLSEPRPQTVIARGRVAAEEGRLRVRVPEVPWRRVIASPEARLTVRWRARAEDFVLPARQRYPGGAAGERGDHAPGGAAAGVRRSVRRARRSRRPLGRAWDRSRFRRPARRPGVHASPPTSTSSSSAAVPPPWPPP